MISYLENASEASSNLKNIKEAMSYERQEAILSAIAQSISGNLSARVHVVNIAGGNSYTDRNDIYVGDDESLIKSFVRLNRRKKVNPFLIRLKQTGHETLHALFTPHKLYEKEITALLIEGYKEEQVRRLFNIVDNLVIESREKEVFGGWLHSAYLYGSYSQLSCSRKLQYIAEEKQWEMAIYNLSCSCGLEGGMRLNGHFSSTKAKKLYEDSKELLTDLLNMSFSDPTRITLIGQVVKMVIDAFPDTEGLSDEEMMRKPMNSRTQDLVSSEESYILPDDNAKESDSLRDEKKKDNESSSEDSEYKQEVQDSEDKVESTDSNNMDSNADFSQEEDGEDSGEFNESKEFESERKLKKLMKEINQYAFSLDRLKENAQISEQKMQKEFGEVVKHVEKQMGSLTVLPEDRLFYNTSINENKRLISSLKTLFKRELNKVKDEKEFYTSGRPDPIRIYAYKRRSVELFKRPIGDSDLNDAAVTVRIDQSGSMSNRFSKRGRKLCNEAGELACVLTEVFSKLKVSLQVSGFAEVGDEEEHEIFRDFNATNSAKESVARSRINKSSATPTGWTIYQGVEELKKRTEKNKVFILITDGYPSSRVSDLFMAPEQIKKHIRQAQRAGIAFICILVGECEPGVHHKIFGDSLVVARDRYSLAVAISPRLKRLAKRWSD